MKRLSTIELCGFVLGIAFVICGVVAIIWPQAVVVFHPANDAIGSPNFSEPEVVSAMGSRIYGVLTLLLGAGLMAASLYREKN